MANSINVNVGSSNSTGVSTSNPQSSVQSSSLAGQPENLQTANSTNINNTSTALPIQLPATSLKSSSAHTSLSPKPSHHKVSIDGLVIAGVIIVLAIIYGLYIFLSAKKRQQN